SDASGGRPGGGSRRAAPRPGSAAPPALVGDVGQEAPPLPLVGRQPRRHVVEGLDVPLARPIRYPGGYVQASHVPGVSASDLRRVWPARRAGARRRRAERALPVRSSPAPRGAGEDAVVAPRGPAPVTSMWPASSLPVGAGRPPATHPDAAPTVARGAPVCA